MEGILTIYEFYRSGRSRLFLRARNLITTAGLAYYGQRMGGGTPAQFVDSAGDFNGVFVLGAPGSSPSASSTFTVFTTGGAGSHIAASLLAPDSGYPKTDDDGTNPESSTGLAPLSASTAKLEQCVTYVRTYGVGVLGTQTVRAAAITVPSPTTGSPLLAFTMFSPVQSVSSSAGYRLVWNHFLQGS